MTIRSIWINSAERSVTELQLPIAPDLSPGPAMKLINGDCLYLIARNPGTAESFFWVPQGPGWMPGPALIVGTGNGDAVSALEDIKRMVQWLRGGIE